MLVKNLCMVLASAMDLWFVSRDGSPFCIVILLG